MRKVMLIMLALLSSSFAYGMVIDMTFEIDKNDRVQLHDLTIGEGEPQRFFNEETGPYEVLLVDSSGEKIDSHSFNTDFWLLSDPPQPLNVSYQDYRLNYSSNADMLLIKHNGTVIFEKKLASQGNCTENGICESNENAFNCYRDCNSSSTDGYCTGLKDGVCDPDCTQSEDPDCIQKVTESPPFNCALPSGMIMLLGAFVITASIASQRRGNFKW